MKATGITSIRVDADWYGGQPDGPDSYDWTALDQVVASIQEVGLSADLIIDGCPPWAAVSGAQGNQFAQPASPAAFANWAAAVAKRYDGKGAKYFEIWNEPNNPSFWAPRPDPAAYTADLKAAYAAIKNVDPSAIVLSGGLAPEPNSSTSYPRLLSLRTCTQTVRREASTELVSIPIVIQLTRIPSTLGRHGPRCPRLARL